MRIEKVIFMGTPEFAVPTLVELSKTHFKPILCITQPDRPKGRKRKITPPEVKVKAEELNIPIIQPENVNSEKVLSQLEEISPDIIITVAYGEFLKKRIRLLPKFGCINLHPSLLPKYRGPAPVNFALFNNDEFTGNTIFKIVAEMDAGPILLQSKIEIEDDDYYTKLLNKLAKIGAKNVIKVLEDIESKGLITSEQDHSKVSYSYKLKKNDFILDWNNSAEFINNRVRGFAESPGLIASFRGKRFKLIEVKILQSRSGDDPGTVVKIIKNTGIVVATKDYDLLLSKVQPSGKRIMSSHAFNLGANIEIGEKFENGF